MTAKISLKNVALDAGVSISTASHALNGTAPLTAEVRDRVIASAQRLGYLEKRRNKATIATLRCILLAVAGDAAPQSDLNLVSWTVMNGLREECERRAIRIVPCVTPGNRIDAAEVKRIAVAEKVDGIVIINDDRPEFIRALAQLAIPSVIINGEDPSMRIDTVTAGNRFGARQAIEHLLALGHRRILHVTWPGRTTIRRRYDGYVDAFLAAGLQAPIDMVVEAESYEPAEGERVLRELLTHDPSLKQATAIFCAADNLALGCLKTLAKAGIKVPDDISVLGCDDILPGEFSNPPLSTIQLPSARLGAAALSLIEQRLVSIDPLRPAHRLELGCRLILRGSIAPPRC
ncbi:LacI family DNA-binding transcriptional regulator [Agrobacterium vitis]|uniref:LacI family DNA-binding transcriptional regulator n=1 Tax=Agrobacterium vitis TaxID=373 RepID=UPI0015DB7D97|nr:LacI family DNA-binding transcriptional regulator [Agrobacterium vitis]MCF1452995.1 LacI family transcriptional regulator [Agrobacterium vitis]BCH55737.1 LacI family transcriptional regulator [Agrobacterium vitis]